MAPGETRSRPIRERQSVCPIHRVRAGVWKGTQERKTGLAAGHWKTVLDGEVLRVGLAQRNLTLPMSHHRVIVPGGLIVHPSDAIDTVIG